MNFLNVFEDRINGVFGASPQGYTTPFSFKKLAKKAAHEMENETFVIDGIDTAPALYTILVSSDDDMAMRPLYTQLTHETSQFLEAQAQGRGYSFVGEPLVRFMVDPSLKSGKFSVFAENVDVRTLNRLRDEESKFMGGADVGNTGGMGGAAAIAQTPQQAQPMASVQPMTPVPPIAPLDGSDAGLDVMPPEVILSARENAVGNQYAAASAQPVAAEQPQVDPFASTPTPAAHAVPIAPVVPGEQQVQQSLQTPQPIPVQAAPAPQAVPTPAPQPAPQAVPAPVSTPTPAPTPMTPATQRRPAANVPLVNPYATTAAPVAAAAAQPSATPATCMLIDRQSGRTFNATAPRTIIGRERTQGGIVLRDPNVSRRHAELSFDGRSWHITDLNSTNGTLVNNVDIDDCVLRTGDLVTLGLINLEFREG